MSSNSSREDVFLGGVRVLVVDDSGPVRGLMTEILEHYGATVTTVNSAYEALAATNVGAPERAGPWSDQVVAEPLMVSLPVVVRGDSAGGNHYRRVVR